MTTNTILALLMVAAILAALFALTLAAHGICLSFLLIGLVLRLLQWQGEPRQKVDTRW